MSIQRPLGFPQTTTAGGGTDAVKVSLHDCLACSGCITSAETVLLQSQSIEEFLARLADPATIVVVSLSPQSVVSLAAVYELQSAEFVGRLTAVLKANGVCAVFDISWARDVSLIESSTEFLHRFQAAKLKNNTPHSTAASLTSRPLPILASACPGWVCYAEKTHGEYILPFVSKVKSPQAIMGTAVKRRWAAAMGIDPARIYHCTVMPCYDKKLEAYRDDFLVPGRMEPVRETDSVLATTEMYNWLQGLKSDVRLACPAAFDVPFSNQVPGGMGRSYTSPGSSGGYMEYIFRTAAVDLFGCADFKHKPLSIIEGRNADVRECTLQLEGRPVLRFASAYGFRNIQGLIRKIKNGRCGYDYVEVMACPSGCLNGGGQMKPSPGQSPIQLIEQLESVYHSDAYLEARSPHDSLAMRELYSDWVQGEPGSDRARELFHTEYHHREKTVTSVLADW